jgi:hypothetical protein
MLQGELVATAREPVADRLIFFAGPQIFPDLDIAQGRQNGLVEYSRPLDIGDA